MRRSERRHLKENALAVAVAGLGQRIQSSSQALGMFAVLVLIGGLGAGGYVWWTERGESRAGILLSDALIVADAAVIPPPPSPISSGASSDDSQAPEFSQPTGSYASMDEKMSAALPKLLEAADAYPASQAGIVARYRAAAALAELGRDAEAADHYQRVVELDEFGVYGPMAILGLAVAQLSQGAYEEAISLLEQSSISDTESNVPIDGVLMQLGRAYQLAGRLMDARATYQRVMEEFPTSLYFPNAERELQTLGIEG